MSEITLVSFIHTYKYIVSTSSHPVKLSGKLVFKGDGVYLISAVTAGAVVTAIIK